MPYKLPHPLTILNRVERRPVSTIKDIIIFQPTLQHLSFPATGMMTLGLIEKSVSTAEMINRRRCADIQQFDCIVRFFFIVILQETGKIFGVEILTLHVCKRAEIFLPRTRQRQRRKYCASFRLLSIFITFITEKCKRKLCQNIT